LFDVFMADLVCIRRAGSRAALACGGFGQPSPQIGLGGAFVTAAAPS
jgi:hypothetical protein